MIKTDTANEILPARSISNTGVGRRIRRVARIVTSPKAKKILLWDVNGVIREFGPRFLDIFDCKEPAITIPY
jgi:hypothetical protein